MGYNSRYVVKGRISGGIIVVWSYEFGDQLWVRFDRTRKTHTCVGCGERIDKKSVGYRPLTNGYNRMLRLCRVCGDRIDLMLG